MIRRMKRQTKQRHSAKWPERTPRIRYRHGMTEVVYFEAPADAFPPRPEWRVLTAADIAG